MPAALTSEQLSAEASVPAERVDWLERLGILKPAAPGRFGIADVFRVRMIAALLEAGFTEEHVEWAVSRGSLDLSHVDRFLVLEPAARSRPDLRRVLERAGERELERAPTLYEVLKALAEPITLFRAIAPGGKE
jgi:hypothetical protein